MDYNTLLGEKIRFYRERRNYTQEHVARAIGVENNTYCRYEKGEIGLKVDRLRRIAEVLEVSVEELMRIDPLIIQQSNNHQANGVVHHQHNMPKEFLDELKAQVEARFAEQERSNQKFIGIIEDLLKVKIS